MIKIISIIALIGAIIIGTNNTPSFGLTTINGGDTLSSSRSVINSNFTELNTGKISVGTTTINSITSLPNLSTVGTITSGVWNGSTVSGAYGGTGTTSPTLNQVMVGNGASGLKVIGFGTSGQFLTSGGSGVAPSWTTGGIDGTQNFNFTGNVLLKNLSASSTVSNPIVLNGVSYNTPSTQGSNGTVLTNNGFGGLTWATTTPVRYSFALIPATVATSNNFATSTALTIPAETLTASSTITFQANFTCDNTNNLDNSCTVYLKKSTGQTVFSVSVGFSGAVSSVFSINTQTIGTYTSSSQTTIGNVSQYGGSFPEIASFAGSRIEQTSTIDLTQETTFSVVIQSGNQMTTTLHSYSIIVNR